MPNDPVPFVCPDPDPYHPQPNSVAVQGATLNADEHWTADKVYLIFDDFAIEGHTLTVDPGTVICLSNTAQLQVGNGGLYAGEIHVNGTADKPVTLTAFASSNDPNKPYYPHRGLRLDTYMQSTLSHLNIWYGGGADWAFELTDTARDDASLVDPTKPLLIDHLTVGEVQSRGFRIGPESGIDPGSSIRFTGYAPPDGGSPPPYVAVEVNYYAEKSVASTWSFDKSRIPSEAQRMRLRTGAPPLILDHDIDLVDSGLPLYANEGTSLIVTGLEANSIATLSIHEGVELHVRGQLVIGDIHEGNLVVTGTAAKPVILTSSEDIQAAGDWEGIYFSPNSFDATKSKIDHAQISYAGISDPSQASHLASNCATPAIAAIGIGGTSPTYEGPSISNTSITHSASHGIGSDSGNNGVHMTTDYSSPSLNITFSDIAGQNLLTGACQ